jgi:hypothetical protein
MLERSEVKEMSVKKEKIKDDIDEVGDKIKASAKAVKNKIEDPDRDIDLEYKKEKLKEDVKDI